jgi:pimeloyl-ACP methyl ester carboxylesterase
VPDARVIAVPSPRSPIEVVVEGESVDVLLLPSAMRSAADFAGLAGALRDVGLGSAAVNPPGVGASGPVGGSVTMREVAHDLANLIDRLATGPVHLVGHALGNTFARATAAYHPDRVRSVALLACGGHTLGKGARPAARVPDAGTMAHFARCHDPAAPMADRLESLQAVFFAAGNDPRAWLDGWWPASAPLSGALSRGDPDEWATAGSAPVLILQPLDDVMAPPAIGRELAASIGSRAHYVDVAHCGHAILPEQPDVVAAHLIEFLRQV